MNYAKKKFPKTLTLIDKMSTLKESPNLRLHILYVSYLKLFQAFLITHPLPSSSIIQLFKISFRIFQVFLKVKDHIFKFSRFEELPLEIEIAVFKGQPFFSTKDTLFNQLLSFVNILIF